MPGISTSDARELAADFERYIDNIVGDFIGQLVPALYAATPKDTTHAATNWIAGTDEPTSPVGSKQSPDKGPQDDSVRALASYTIRMGNLILANVVTYIGALNDGYSPKAPAGYVPDTIVRVLAQTLTRWLT